MSSERIHPDFHPDLVVLLDVVVRERGGETRSAWEHSLCCVSCTRVLQDLVQIGAAMFEGLLPCETSAGLRALAFEAAGLRLPRSTPERGRPGSAAPAGSG